jgi:hypothetical protein
MIERRNPLPVGRYWIEVSQDPVPLGTWRGFLSAFPEFVHVDQTEEDDASTFAIFTTSKALVWPDGIGAPNIADPTIKSRADTVQRPDPEPDFIDTIPTAKQLWGGLGDLVTVVALGAGLVLAIKLLGSGRAKR